MSASDKKQQRKAEMAEELTQKQRKEQADAARAKQKKLIYSVVGVVCAVAAAALLVWNSLGSLGRYATAATVDGVSYKVPDLQYYYVSAKNQFYSTYQSYIAYGLLNYNPSVSDGAQWYNEDENQTYADLFRDSALSYLKQTTAMCAAAKAEGYTISEAGLASVNAQLASIDVVCAQNNLTRNSYFSQVYGNGVTEKVFVKNLKNDILASEYAARHQQSLSYDDASLDAYYNENPDELDSYDYRSFFINGTAPAPTDESGAPLTDENGNTVTASDEEKAAALAEAKKKADEAVKEIKAASDKEKTFAEIAPKYVSEANQDAYTNNEDATLSSGVFGTTLTSNGSVLSSWLKDSARKAGDVDVIETSSGYYVVLFLDRYLDQDPTVNVRHILIQPEIADDAETNSKGAKIPTPEAMEAAKAEAQSLMEQWKAGEATAESFSALAEEHSDDGRNEDGSLYTPGGLYSHVYQGQMVPNFDKWIFDPARTTGNVDLVENSGDDARYYGWHVVYFDGTDEPYWKTVASSAKLSADQTKWLEDIDASMEAAATDGMKHVGDANTAKPTPAASAEPSESPAA